MKSTSDEALVKRIQAGDERAFAELVERYQDRLYRLANGMLFRQSAAPDAVQEVFLRAFSGFASFRFGASVYTWLYAVLRNVCREMNRKERYTETIAVEEPHDTGPSVEARASDDQRLRRLAAVVRRLPERQRDVFLLRVMEGLSVSEAARVLRCREGTVKTHLHRAMKTVRASDPDGEFGPRETPADETQ